MRWHEPMTKSRDELVSLPCEYKWARDLDRDSGRSADQSGELARSGRTTGDAGRRSRTSVGSTREVQRGGGCRASARSRCADFWRAAESRAPSLGALSRFPCADPLRTAQSCRRCTIASSSALQRSNASAALPSHPHAPNRCCRDVLGCPLLLVLLLRLLLLLVRLLGGGSSAASGSCLCRQRVGEICSIRRQKACNGEWCPGLNPRWHLHDTPAIHGSTCISGAAAAWNVQRHAVTWPL